MFCDSHAHLTCDPVFNEVSKILDRAKEVEVNTIINICTDKISLERGLLLARSTKQVYNVGATTPHDVKQEGGMYFHLFEEAARNGKLVAVGETGLDYYYENSPKSLQQAFLIRYLQLAKDYNLPIVIHCRDAFEDLFSITDEHYKKEPLLLHCFTGTLEEAEKAIGRDWLISFSGIITFKDSENLRKVVKEIPINRLLVETDTPYLAPQSKRGKSNEPCFLPEIAQKVANIKGLTLQEVAKATTRNAREFFSLS